MARNKMKDKMKNKVEGQWKGARVRKKGNDK